MSRDGLDFRPRLQPWASARKLSVRSRISRLKGFILAILLRVWELPSVPVHGVWRTKDDPDCQHQHVTLDARSPKLARKLEGDLSIVESDEELSEG